MIESICSF